MLDIAKGLIGKSVEVNFIPLPYLGRGITEPAKVVGTLASIRTMQGKNYIVLKSGNKVVLEKNIMEIESIVDTTSARTVTA